ncbi:MAG: ATP-binding protein [Dysosmobacter welbionis]
MELKFINRWVRLSVSDTGCGIQEDQIPFLFDRYLHDDAMAPQPHGLGLGLPICQHIAERHGGTMIAESRPGQGSRFTLSLPDRRCGTADVSDVKFDYNGGFNPLLLALADALPPGFLPAPSGLTLAPAGVGFFAEAAFLFPEIGYNSPITRPALRRPFQEEPIYVPACICGHERRRGQRRSGAAAAAGRL